jgi:hypothetical protein
MNGQNSSEPTITLPYGVYEAMAICYYGGGPRHKTAPSSSTQEEFDPVTINENPQSPEIEALLKKAAEARPTSQLKPFSPLGMPGKPMGYAKRRIGNAGADEVSSKRTTVTKPPEPAEREDVDAPVAERTDQAPE